MVSPLEFRTSSRLFHGSIYRQACNSTGYESAIVDGKPAADVDIPRAIPGWRNRADEVVKPGSNGEGGIGRAVGIQPNDPITSRVLVGT